MKLYQLIAETVQWEPPKDSEWEGKREDLLSHIEKNLLPHGGGIDNGCRIEDKVRDNSAFALFTEFHHLNGNGFYDGWTAHKVWVNPHLVYGFAINISGSGRNGVMEFLHQVFEHSLSQEVDDQAIKKEVWHV